jgi:segregation and condensation protein A
MGDVSDELAAYKVELPEFEGPLDLLLHLVKKHELSIVDIPIAFITDQYLKMITLLEQLNIEIAAEYLVMAATLCHLKSRELVPPDPNEQAELEAAEEEEGADPRQELIRRLLEYQKYKEAAAQLGDRPVVGRNVWTRGSRAEDVAGLHVLGHGAPLAEVPVIHLIESLERVLSRAKVTLTHDVVVDRTTITDKINELADRLEAEGSFTFESCFSFVEREMPLSQVKHQVVVTFLAILEMTRVKLIRLTQPEERGAIYISRSSDDLRGQIEELKKKTEEYR